MDTQRHTCCSTARTTTAHQQNRWQTSVGQSLVMQHLCGYLDVCCYTCVLLVASATSSSYSNLLTTLYCPAHTQVELHAIPGVDQRGVAHPQAVLDEVWHRTVGADPGNWPAAWQAHPAAQRCHAAASGAAVPGRCVAGQNRWRTPSPQILGSQQLGLVAASQLCRPATRLMHGCSCLPPCCCPGHPLRSLLWAPCRHRQSPRR